MKSVYVASGVARDSEHIVAVRDWMEDVIREQQGISFSSTKLFTSYNKKTKLMEFKLKCYE